MSNPYTASAATARAWLTVWRTLYEVCPALMFTTGTGTERACEAIRKLAANQMPENAVVPKYKVGDQVIYDGRERTIISCGFRYSLYQVMGVVREEQLSPVPPKDPLRAKFEELAEKEDLDLTRSTSLPDAYEQDYTQGMWYGFKLAMEGAQPNAETQKAINDSYLGRVHKVASVSAMIADSNK